MPLYDVKLQSPDTEQFRVVTVDSANEQMAQMLALQREQEFLDYQIADDPNAEADFDTLRHRVVLHRDGKISASVDEQGVAGNARTKARVQMHLQEHPFEVVEVNEKLPSIGAIIDSLKALQGNQEAWNRTIQALRDEGVPIGVVTGSLYGLTSQGMIDGSGSIVWSSATIKTGLTTSAYTPNQDTHHFWSDVTNEATGTGYTAGGVTLGSKTSTYDTATDQTRLDAADASWGTSTITARRAVVWNDTAGASTTDPIIGWVDFGADVASTAGTFQIAWDATGIVVYDVT